MDDQTGQAHLHERSLCAPAKCHQDSAFLVSESRERRVGVRFPVASSEVWTASCPAAMSCRASLSGSWASTTNFIQRRGAPHGAGQSTKARLDAGEQVVATLEIGMVPDNLVDAHPRCQLQQALDRVAQPAHRRLAMANRRVGGEPVQPRHTSDRTASSRHGALSQGLPWSVSRPAIHSPTAATAWPDPFVSYRGSLVASSAVPCPDPRASGATLRAISRLGRHERALGF